MYNVFSFEESEAKQFIDALYTVMGKQETATLISHNCQLSHATITEKTIYQSWRY